ncbi:Mitochondrial uncoupling protein 3 [Frankliniella fusca]|uniref:Mitochondrial uncoupling protein 3 n=1 Tax=Frankliniella fusca TaxID=407009 RepID=A0AAE1L5I3_9NEOP|nr:Mitochondrial uncoupling protein 3 [Frankliniella fusca]
MLIVVYLTLGELGLGGCSSYVREELAWRSVTYEDGVLTLWEGCLAGLYEWSRWFTVPVRELRVMTCKDVSAQELESSLNALVVCWPDMSCIKVHNGFNSEVPVYVKGFRPVCGYVFLDSSSSDGFCEILWRKTSWTPCRLLDACLKVVIPSELQEEIEDRFSGEKSHRTEWVLVV